MHSLLERIFGLCAGCIARDYHIASLKEELRKRNGMVDVLEGQIDSYTNNQNEIIKHITGMNRVVPGQQPSPLTSVPRKGGMGSRIAHAEAEDRLKAGPLIEQRRKEYNERISSLSPEIELVEEKDAS